MTGAYAHVHALRDPGLFVLSATARPRDAQKSVGALVDQALALVDDLDADELDKARDRRRGRARAPARDRAGPGAHARLERDGRRRSAVRARLPRSHPRGAPPRRRGRGASLPAARERDGRRDPARKRAARRARPRSRAQAEKRVRQALARRDRAATAPAEKRVVLPNGMVLLVRRDPSVPVVAMRAVWRGGQRVEDAEHAGASTLLARMITRGCGDARRRGGRRSRRSARRLARRRRRAATASASRPSGSRASWQPGFDLFADCILDRRARRRRARAREAPAPRRSGRAGRQPDARSRSACSARRSTARTRTRATCSARADSIGGARSRAELAAFYRDALSGLGADARDRRRRRRRRRDRARDASASAPRKRDEAAPPAVARAGVRRPHAPTSARSIASSIARRRTS